MGGVQADVHDRESREILLHNPHRPILGPRVRVRMLVDAPPVSMAAGKRRL